MMPDRPDDLPDSYADLKKILQLNFWSLESSIKFEDDDTLWWLERWSCCGQPYSRPDILVQRHGRGKSNYSIWTPGEDSAGLCNMITKTTRKNPKYAKT